ncbi:MAG: hypothetical protein SNF33_05830 [Candidatus Algichlamydia australiensis]|nr:hypothetical protein [Chlamydiales bacterium]
MISILGKRSAEDYFTETEKNSFPRYEQDNEKFAEATLFSGPNPSATFPIYEGDEPQLFEEMIAVDDFINPKEKSENTQLNSKELFWENIGTILARKDTTLLKEFIKGKDPDCLAHILYGVIENEWIDGVPVLLESSINFKWRNPGTKKTLLDQAISSKWEAFLIERFLFLGAEIDNFQNEDGDTTLHLAAGFGKIETCRMLLDSLDNEKKSFLMIKNNMGLTVESILLARKIYSIKNTKNKKRPVIEIVEITKNKDLRKLKKLLQGKSADCLSSFLNVVFRRAWKEGIEEILNHDFNPVWLNPKNGKTLLEIAMRKNHRIYIIKLLKAMDSIENFRDQEGNTVLHLAAKFCGRQNYNTILEAIRDKKELLLPIKNNDELTPTEIRKKRYPTTPARKKRRVKHESIHRIFLNKDVEALKNVIKNQDADLLASFLSQSMNYGWTKGVNIILKSNFNRFWRHPETGKSLLETAICKNNTNFISSLLKIEALFDQSIGDKGNTTLHIAAFYCRKKSYKMIVEAAKKKNADFFAIKNHDGLTADDIFNQRMSVTKSKRNK